MENTQKPLTIAMVNDLLLKENTPSSILFMNIAREFRKRGHIVKILCANPQLSVLEGFHIAKRRKRLLERTIFSLTGQYEAKINKKELEVFMKDVNIVFSSYHFNLGVSSIKYGLKNNLFCVGSYNTYARNLHHHLTSNGSAIPSQPTIIKIWQNYYSKLDLIHYPSLTAQTTVENYSNANNVSFIARYGVNESFDVNNLSLIHDLKYLGDKIIILVTGKLLKNKGYKTIINAVHNSKYEKDINLVFAGSGKDEDQIVKYSEKLTNKPLIRFFSREDLIRLLNNVKLYIDASIVEFESLGLLEAISCGVVPIISNSAFNSGRTIAISENNSFKTKDDKDLTNKIDYWLDNEKSYEDNKQMYIKRAKNYKIDVVTNIIVSNILKAYQNKRD